MLLESFVPFRVYRFIEFEVFRSSTVPFAAHEHWAFPAFAAFSLRAQKSAACCDV